MTRKPSSNQQELTCIRRTAKVIWHLAHGESLTVGTVCAMTGLSRQGAEYLLAAASNVIPIYRADTGEWQICAAREGE